jgi:DNA polymerase V
MMALVDCNAFFCSCEKLFRPDLKNTPMIVLSNNDGCVVAATRDVKNLGVRIGTPYFQIKDLCRYNKIAIFSSNFSLYTNISDRVMKTLSRFTNRIEAYSIDEAFLDISGIKNIEDFSREIKNAVEQEVGIPVGIGVAPTKVLAKVANNIAKKNKYTNGIVVLDSIEKQNHALKIFPIEDIWGIGGASAAKLKMLGIKTALQFRDYSNENHLRKLLSVTGIQRKQELKGISCFVIENVFSPKQQIQVSRTFGQAVSEITPLKEAIANYVTSGAQRLRAQDSVCGEIAVYFLTDRFNKEIIQHQPFKSARFLSPTANTIKLIEAALALVDKMYEEEINYKKAGILISRIAPKDQTQINLFEPADDEKNETLMKVMDRINTREGEMLLKSLACGVDNQAWRMLRDHKSPRFTTSWNELPKVI